MTWIGLWRTLGIPITSAKHIYGFTDETKLTHDVQISLIVGVIQFKCFGLSDRIESIRRAAMRCSWLEL